MPFSMGLARGVVASVLLAITCGACGASPNPPPTPAPSPARPAAVVDAGETSSTRATKPSSRAQRFLDASVSSAWVYPDAASRKDRAQRLAAKLDKQLDGEHDRATTGAGIAFALVVDGEIVLLKARGIADLEGKRVATPDTIFRIASITKTFTATTLMSLRDEGKIQLADPLASHLAELDVGYPHKDDAPIRIEQLLTHSAGLARSGPYAELARPSTEADLVDAMRLPLTGDPGVAHAYSNFGFGLLGLMIGRKVGAPYREVVRQRLLAPLEMTSSGFDLASLPPERLAVGYRRERGANVAIPLTKNGAGEAAGGLFSTAKDMAQWLRFQLAAWPPRDDADDGPVHRATLREMHTPRLTFGLGSSVIAGGTSRAYARSVGLAWEVARGCYFDRLVGHDGDLDGFHARLRFDPNRGFGLVLLANSDAADASGILDRLLDTIASEDALAQRRRAPAPELVARVSDIVRRLGGTWTADDHDKAFTDTLRARFPHAEALAVAARIAKDVGGACTFVSAERVVDALDAELVYRCARGNLYVSARGTGSPLRLFGFAAEAGAAPDTDQQDVAKAILARMQTRDEAQLAKALRTKAGVANQSRALLKAGAEIGVCRIESGEAFPWIRAANFRLACARGKATLKLSQHENGTIEVSSLDTETRCLR